jgi:gliding motility-associated-like protein
MYRLMLGKSIRFQLWVLSMCCAILSASAQIGLHENKGQFDEPITYRVNYGSHVVFLDQTGFSILLHDQEVWGNIIEHLHHHQTRVAEDNFEYPDKLRMQHIKFELVDADFSNHQGTEIQEAYYNYFIGDDSTRWAGNVRSFEKVLYKNIYPNIDLEYEVIEKRFKYNFILNKGADLSAIKLKIVGADSVRVTEERLIVHTRFGDFSEVMPLSYEEQNGRRNQIKMFYEKRGDVIGFKTQFFKNKVKTVIDPELIFSTYSGSTVDNFGFTATFDLDGALYSGGIVTSPTSVANGRYPATPGAFDETFNGGDNPTPTNPNNTPWDIGISKYSPDGSTLEYATYLGGSRNEYPHSLIVNENDELVVFGTSASPNYPTTNGAFSPSLNGGVDIILTKFSADGSALVGSTFIGGIGNDGLNSQSDMNSYYADEYRGEVNLDDNGNVIIASSTYSNDFPITVNAFQNTSNGDQEGVIFSLNKDFSNIRWSTYFGSSGAEAIYGVDVMTDGNLLVSGATNSTDLPTTASAYQTDYQGGTVDGFVAKLTATGNSLLACTYFGTDQYDQVLASDRDRNDNVYVAGHTTGSMPVIGNVYSNSNGKQFVAKLTNDLSSIIVSTVYGSGRAFTDLTINALLVDNCDRVYLSGWGTNFETLQSRKLTNMPLTPDAYQSTTNGQDFHIMVLEENLSDILYGTYYGGTRTDDHVDGGTSRFDKRGSIYQSVCSSCPGPNDGGQVSDFPTSVGAYSENNPSPRCSNASFKIQVVPVNEKPVVPTITYTTDILNPLSFDYEVSDPEQDSIYVAYNIPIALSSYLQTGQATDTALNSSTVNFTVQFDCASAGDTFIINTGAKDLGCPFPESNSGQIRIIVDSVPVLPPPGVLCINFGRSDELRIDWGSTETSPYFKQMDLYKVTPKGVTTRLLEIDNQGEGSYTDFDVDKPRENNYTYYLVVQNICDQLGDRTYELNSVKESEVPVDPTYLIATTVQADSIMLYYERSTEDDFSSYEIYRKVRGANSYEYIDSKFDIDDTTFTDINVNVNAISYCYVIKVLDNCGHISPNSNEGCTIVITGKSQNKEGETPRYYMDLDWLDYVNWPNGVDYYELIRSVDTGILRPIVQLNDPTLSYTDADLDYDWGGYWYSVIAYENEGKHNATSRSNDIYLIQPPEVYVPNAVTANGDNLNDKFGWGDVFVKEFEMKLYNRWGEKVFESTDKNTKWDGMYKDQPLDYSNVYFWIVTYKGWDGIRHIKNGTVTFIR